MSKVFINHTHPYLRIYNPDTGDYAQFVGGKLELEDDDPNMAVVLEHERTNPLTTILETAKGGKNCPECGALFTGHAAAAQLGKHRQQSHFDAWLADKQASDSAETNEILKTAAGIACDVCQPAQVFPDEKALQQHIRLLHTAPEEPSESVTERRPGEVEPATKKG